jgi:hypothetical protein
MNLCFHVEPVRRSAQGGDTQGREISIATGPDIMYWRACCVVAGTAPLVDTGSR